MITQLLTIKPLLKSFSIEEEDKQRRINRNATDSIIKQLKEPEMECSNCCEYKSVDVYSIMKHEQQCENFTDKEFEEANNVLLKKGFVNEIRNKINIYQCDRCDKVFKNKNLLNQHNLRGKNPKGCLRVHMNNILKNMDDETLMKLKELMKDNFII